MVKFLRKKHYEKIVENNNKIYLDRELFEELLSKKDFLSVYEKKVWRSLGGISCDNNGERFTKIVRIKKEVFRKIVIEIEPQKTIENLR